MSNKRLINLWLLCVLGLSCVLWWMVLSWTSDVINPNKPVHDIKRNDRKHFLLQFLFQHDHVLAGILSGVVSLIVSWTLTYFNWTHVGTFPATPLSPNKDNLNPSMAIFSSFGLAPLLISITTGCFTFLLVPSH